jgi:hypothetical protein
MALFTLYYLMFGAALPFGAGLLGAALAVDFGGAGLLLLDKTGYVRAVFYFRVVPEIIIGWAYYYYYAGAFAVLDLPFMI